MAATAANSSLLAPGIADVAGPKGSAAAAQTTEQVIPGTASAGTASVDKPTSSASMHRRVRSTVHHDYLSDKATTALIRRVLCAQHIGERGRSSTPAPIEELLPPLTSRNDVDLQLYALIAIVLREYVQNWYTKITPDETFVDEVVQIIAHCTRALEQRLRKVDLESLLLDELPELFDTHVRAYRAASSSAARPPVEANLREIYHSLWPLPALSPVPKADDARSVQTQAANEASYRQLLVQGVLALLLPTEDLENECLTSLVGQIFSELIIGNLVANKISEPWLLWELIIILTRSARKNKEEAAPSPLASSASGPTLDSRLRGDHSKRSSTITRPKGVRGTLYFQQIFWSLIQWGFIAVSSIRLVVTTFMLSRTPPPRPTHISYGQKVDQATSHYDSDKPHNPPGSSRTQRAPVPVPIAAVGLWTFLANLLEMDVRMPWLSGTLSLMLWGGTEGPGRIAGYDGTIDRLLSFHIRRRLFDPGNLPPLLRSIRAAIFPNNAPGAPGLVAPSSDLEFAALRRRCAKAVWALVPKGVGSLYFGGASPVWPSSGAARPSATSPISASHEQTTAIPGRTGTATASVPRSGPQSTATTAATATDATAANAARIVAANHRASDKTSTAEDGDLQVATTADHASSEVDLDPAASSKRGLIPGERRWHGIEHAALAPVRGTADEVLLQDDEGTQHSQSCNEPTDPEEERILSEIEGGMIDLLSDAYCNKHLMYGILELVLVRLMPELGHKGIIELWEERLS